MSKLDPKLINSLCDHCEGTYCFLKELLHINSLYDKRLLVQFKCMEIFKYELGQIVHKDIGWNQAAMQWHDSKYAKWFDQAYFEESQKSEPDFNPRKIYKRLKEIARISEIGTTS